MGYCAHFRLGTAFKLPFKSAFWLVISPCWLAADPSFLAKIYLLVVDIPMLIASILAGSITSLIVWFSCCSNPYNHIICQCFNPGLFSLSQEELAALEELSSAMKSGGVWVLSFFHGGMGMSGWPPSMWLLG